MAKKAREARPERRRGKSGIYDYYASLPAGVDFRERPELYRVGRGEQGVLMVEPYKSEILPNWRFATVAAARESSEAIYGQFQEYLRRGDFVGADMARKFIQMGYTRARRYANYKGGRKYDAKGVARERQNDEVKAGAARVFYGVWKRVRENETYLGLKRRHQAAYG